jgi:hypothetical protein
MDKDLIVAIFAPTTTGKNTGVVGTGYPVGEDLILTSRHVVEPENRNPRVPIRIRWFYDKPTSGEAPGWVQIEKADLVWIGEGNLDAALIRCRRPESLGQYRARSTGVAQAQGR